MAKSKKGAKKKAPVKKKTAVPKKKTAPKKKVKEVLPPVEEVVETITEPVENPVGENVQENSEPVVTGDGTGEFSEQTITEIMVQKGISREAAIEVLRNPSA